MKITLTDVTKHRGIAGQYSYEVSYRYDTGASHRVTFVGSEYGAPVVMVDGTHQWFVSDWRQYGDTLNVAWVRRFYGISD